MNTDCGPATQACRASRTRACAHDPFTDLGVGQAGDTLGVGKLFCAVGLAAALSGCAVSFVDRNGDTHYQGLLVHVVVQKTDDKREICAESVRVKSFGLSLLSGLQRTNITLGYNDDTMTLVRGDSCMVTGGHLQETPFRPAAVLNLSTGGSSNEKN